MYIHEAGICYYSLVWLQTLIPLLSPLTAGTAPVYWHALFHHLDLNLTPVPIVLFCMLLLIVLYEHWLTLTILLALKDWHHPPYLTRD